MNAQGTDSLGTYPAKGVPFVQNLRGLCVRDLYSRPARQDVGVVSPSLL